MIEVIPPQTSGNKLLGKSGKIVVYLEPIFVNNDGLNILHQSKLSRSNFLDAIAIVTNNRPPLVIEARPIVNKIQTTHEVSLIHIERRTQHFNIELSIELRVHENDLSVFRRSVLHASGIIVALHKRKHITRATESLSIILGVSTVHSNRLHTAARDGLNNHVLEQQILVIVSGSIDAINDSGNKVSHTLSGEERHSQLFVRDRNRINDTPVHSMESTMNIGLILFQLSVLSLLLRELENPCNVNKDFLDTLTVIQITLLESLIRIVKGRTLYTNKGDAVNQRIDKLVSESRSTIDNLTNARNIMRGCYGRNTILVRKTGILTNDIHNIYGACVQRRYGNSMSHNQSPLLSRK